MTAPGHVAPFRTTNRRKLSREAFTRLRAFRALTSKRKATDALGVSEDVLDEALADGFLREDTAARIERALLGRGAA